MAATEVLTAVDTAFVQTLDSPVGKGIGPGKLWKSPGILK